MGGTVFVRRFLHAIDTVHPDARWLALTRPGLDGRTVSIYRWLNRRDGDAPTIGNVDGTIYRAGDDQPVGVAAAGRDYAGMIGQVQITLPRDRGSLVVGVTSARSRGTLDDTHDAGIGRSDRFASPTAALTDVDGPSTLTPDLAITVFGTTRVPLAADPGERDLSAMVGSTLRRPAHVRRGDAEPARRCRTAARSSSSRAARACSSPSMT